LKHYGRSKDGNSTGRSQEEYAALVFD